MGGVTAFQRARSEEQRTVRRQSILQTAAAMLDEMPVAALSLNELSRRVGLAKSNVLRYFESREAVLLDLLDHAAAELLTEIDEALQSNVDPSAPPHSRAQSVASALATSFATHPMLCELLSAQAGVLERNVSIEVATRYKQGARDSLVGLATLLQRLLPELKEERSARAASMIIILVGALWTHNHPAPAVLAAYDADPSLAFMHVPFAEALEQTVATFLVGMLIEGAHTP
ncbi:TetR family transcriptional regulator [Parafrankia sp. FMc6]|uniref:TetR/AcrR family transcriptional regulator n=1 Tax=Parafrankia soli TaxID=2599596 RepID=UPI0034D622C6